EPSFAAKGPTNLETLLTFPSQGFSSILSSDGRSGTILQLEFDGTVTGMLFVMPLNVTPIVALPIACPVTSK
ncbi:MAG: hypothetical protein GYA55_03145, partial [SAR324 cluster bacterium]|nr:hypothetical protein [SAR324 cluster bacterium]